MRPTALEECLRQCKTNAVRNLAAALKVGVYAGGEGVFDYLGTVDECPLGTRAAAFGNDFHRYFLPSISFRRVSTAARSCWSIPLTMTEGSLATLTSGSSCWFSRKEPSARR